MRWVAATVVDTFPETISAVTVRLDVPDWPGHRPGQHLDLRLTGEDGYTAHRTYSIASAPGVEPLELTVARLETGEVSPYLTGLLGVGDQVELRGPIGGYFTWDADDCRPVHLVAGGTGVVPLMSMFRHHAAIDHGSAVHLLYSARTSQDLLYCAELEGLRNPRRAVTTTVTREPPGQWTGRRGRVDAELLEATGWPAHVHPRCYVCGPTSFVEAVSFELVGLGHAPGDVMTERFGASGG